MKKKELEKYVKRYLKSWTGNNPKKVLQYFGKSVIFIDPANPGGIANRKDLENYITPLLKRNNEWTWELTELIPNKNGCIVKSKATIPLKNKNIGINCVEILEIKGRKILRNEIFFDQPKGYKLK